MKEHPAVEYLRLQHRRRHAHDDETVAIIEMWMDGIWENLTPEQREDANLYVELLYSRL